MAKSGVTITYLAIPPTDPGNTVIAFPAGVMQGNTGRGVIAKLAPSGSIKTKTSLQVRRVKIARGGATKMKQGSLAARRVVRARLLLVSETPGAVRAAQEHTRQVLVNKYAMRVWKGNIKMGMVLCSVRTVTKDTTSRVSNKQNAMRVE